MKNKHQARMMTDRQKQGIEHLLGDRRVDDIHKKSVANALRQGFTNAQAVTEKLVYDLRQLYKFIHA